MVVSVGPVITVFGGSSVSTPILVEDVGRAVAAGSLPALTLRLWGRAADRLEGVAAVGRRRLGGAEVRVEAHTDLGAALDGATLVLGQVRPGGFLGRAADEALALAEDIPGDEGLGPSGLACYLRGRKAMDALSAAVARWSPQAPYLQLTSPLGLQVARARRLHGVQCYGVCELVGTTAEKVIRHVAPKLGTDRLVPSWAGLNHQTWIHRFVDEAGQDRTSEIVNLIDDPRLVEIDPSFIREAGAVPVNYLRLYLHTARELAKQRGRTQTRGAELDGWASELEAAYVGGPDFAAVDRLLSSRHVNWYAEGVVPAFQAFLGEQPTRISLNLPGGGAHPAADPAAVVELPCQVSRSGVVAEAVPPLPPGPAALTKRLLVYEAAVLDLPDVPTVEALTAALALHPLVDSEAKAARLAGGMVAAGR